MNRLEHPEVYNRDIHIKEGKHGDDNTRWTFPSMLAEDMVKKAYYNFEKIDVFINDTRLDR